MDSNDQHSPPTHQQKQDATQCLRPYIDFAKVQCHNEYEPNSGKLILKPYESRFSNTPRLISPKDDAELLLCIPFTEAVSLQQLCLRGGGNSSAAKNPTAGPWHVRLFVDRDSLDLGDVHELQAAQELQVLPLQLEGREDENGMIVFDRLWHGKFKDIGCLAIYVVDNYGHNVSTELTYIGLFGEVSHLQRKAVQKAIHEGQGLPSEYKAFEGAFPGPCVSDSRFS